MFLIYSEKQKFDWKFYVVFLVYVYNVIKSDVMGCIFYYLMFGWYFKLFIDVFFGIDLDFEEGDYYIYIKNLGIG